MDKRAKFTYKIIETAVGRGLKYIEESGNRGVRYIVDLGAHFTKGISQNRYFDIAQKVLNDEDSKYYKFAKEMASNIDHRILKKFGVNLGHNVFIYGSKQIDEYEQESGCAVPWTILLDFKSKEYNLSQGELSDFLDSCESVGIFSGQIFVEDNESILNDILPVLKKHEDAAYFLFVNLQVLSDAMIDMIADASNILVVVNYNEKEDYSKCEKAVKKLSDKKCIYGISSDCSNENIEFILDDSYLKDINNLTYSFVCLLENGVISNENYLKQMKFMKKINNENDYPFFIVDFFEGIKYVGAEFSHESCFIAVDGSGRVYALLDNKYMNEKLNIKYCKMGKILKYVQSES